SKPAAEGKEAKTCIRAAAVKMTGSDETKCEEARQRERGLREGENAMTALARMRGIGKRFGPVTVLEGVDFEIRAGEVHVLAGENGAGKSTLIKILGGIYKDFEGTVEKSSADVRVAVIHQELSLVGPMSVADNIFLGRE